jgi:hypothetical protein
MTTAALLEIDSPLEAKEVTDPAVPHLATTSEDTTVASTLVPAEHSDTDCNSAIEGPDNLAVDMAAGSSAGNPAGNPAEIPGNLAEDTLAGNFPAAKVVDSPEHSAAEDSHLLNL